MSAPDSAASVQIPPGLEIFAHRGFSSREPEGTAAAYRAAIDFAAEHRIALGVECDVRFTADDQLVCLHDADVDRVSNGSGPVAERTLEELRQLDFGSWFVANPTAEQRTVLTLAELLDLIGDARDRGVDITLNLEIKYPNPREASIEEEVARLLTERGWTGPDSPVYVITFFPESMQRVAEVLPELRRTYLIGRDLSPIADGGLPYGVKVAAPDVKLLRSDPDFVKRAQGHGNEVHVWTVNDIADIRYCLDLGVTGLTSDYPDRVLEELSQAPSDG